GIDLADVTERAPLPARVESTKPLPAPPTSELPQGAGLRVITYRPLFSGAAVERTPELEFMTPAGEIELAPDDATARGIASGDAVTIRSNGTSRDLRARIARDLTPGLVRIPLGDAAGLHEYVEVSR